MSELGKLGVALLLGLMIFFMIRRLKANPEMLSKHALSKSFGTMGILALILIAFVGFLIFALRHS